MKAIKQLIAPALFVALALLAIVSILLKPVSPVEGSTARGSEYQATTTSTGRFLNDVALQTTSGTLGSVVITGAAAGVISLYDATTTNVSQRAASMSTSSILVASFPASAAAGTYTFDEILINGLYVDITGTMPTSTITFRQ